jgi:hypothetical protein
MRRALAVSLYVRNEGPEHRLPPPYLRFDRALGLMKGSYHLKRAKGTVQKTDAAKRPRTGVNSNHAISGKTSLRGRLPAFGQNDSDVLVPS